MQKMMDKYVNYLDFHCADTNHKPKSIIIAFPMLSNFNVPHGLSFCKFDPQTQIPQPRKKCSPNCTILMTNPVVVGSLEECNHLAI
jgi:hypothetical protein